METSAKRGRDISPEELKKIQLGILDEVDVFCRKNNIKYFLMYGTLLGAVRHKGYIPWDDDIDIGMLREDYDRFVSTFESRNGDMAVMCYEKNPKCIYPFAKVFSNKTVFYDTNVKNALGVNIDVFPLDYLPRDKKKRSKLIQRAKLYRNIMTFKYIKVSKRRNFIKNAAVVCGKALKVVPNRVLASGINKLQRSVSNNTGLVGWMLNSPRVIVFDASLFEDITEIEFEGRFYLAPMCFDEVLSKEYGNYMELPPESERISHHAFVAYWKTDEEDQRR